MLELLKEKFLNKEVNLVDLDNEVLRLVPDAHSIFDYDVREMLENSFCYQCQTDTVPAGYNFEFEIVEDSEDATKIVAKVIDIFEV